MTEPTSHLRPLVMCCIGTYRRNEPLARLLEALKVSATRATELCRLGVVIVDDNPDGRAETIVDKFRSDFEGGVHYRHLGSGNISLVRNEAIETALEGGADWIAMTDDDCVPVPEWISGYLEAAAVHGGPAFTADCPLEAPPGAPRWMRDEPFLSHQLWGHPDGAVVPTAATNNSFIDARWLRDHPDIRFDPGLGVVGGEDMVFFRTAIRRGLVVRFVERAIVIGHEPIERARLGYQLRASWWYGNTRHVTESTLHATNGVHSLVRGLKEIGRGVAHPVSRLVQRRNPQLRWALSRFAEGAGLIAGALGLRVRHH